MTISSEKVQIRFIEKIRNSLPKNISLAETLAETLNISTDSAYRRIRGSTSLTIDEVITLCNRFKINFDLLSEDQAGTVTFNYQILSENEQNFDSYLKRLEDSLDNLRSFKEKKISYVADDVPLFHYFRYPELTAFKMYFWQKSNIKDYKDSGFDMKSISPSLLGAAKRIHDKYLQIPSIEIWTEQTVGVRQLDYFHKAGKVSSEMVLLLCTQFIEMLENVKKQATDGTKFSSLPGNFQLYLSELMVDSNTILVCTDQGKVVYKSFNMFNTLSTSNPIFCNETENWLDNVVKLSTLLSGSAERSRDQLFNDSINRIKKLKKQIEDDQEQA